MDDDEDFEALFFTECVELLGELQDHLELLSTGGGDDETVNAAFRAVHSVKGGAAAFGFTDLISFAHVFETVMDQVRSNQLVLHDEVSEVLLRAGDVMELLVERAQAGSEEPVDTFERVLAELKEFVETEVTQENVADEVVVYSDVADNAEPSSEDLNTIVISFAPGEEFFRSGHDPLRLIRAARDKGLASIEISGDLPALDSLDIGKCPFSWVLTFETSETENSIWDFLSIYTSSAQFDAISEPDCKQEQDDEVPPTPMPPSTENEDAASEDPASVTTPAEIENPRPMEKAKPAEAAIAKAQAPKSLRVELARVDRLVNLVGEMLITQSGLAQKLTTSFSSEVNELGHSVETLSRQLRELQENVMGIRAQPIKLVFSRMPRVVRDLSDKLDKKVRLELYGEGTEIDTTVIEELAEPLTHMIRNSMDHGLEYEEERLAAGKSPTGTIKLSAEHRGERVIINVEDDGKGINREVVLRKAIERGLVSAEDTLSPNEIDGLIFHPGFSTAQEISAVSGRGVGMDVVKKKIQTLGGRCILTSTPGKGTKFAITLPLTLAVMDGMTISVNSQQFILPLSAVIEAIRLSPTDVKVMPDGSSIINRRGDYLRIINLRHILNMPKNTDDSEMAIIVDTETDGYIALVVDELIGQRQVVLKSLEANYKKINGVSGATILGDGKVALILDVPSLLQMDTHLKPKLELAS